MKHSMYQDLWQGKEALLAQPALRCGDTTLSFDDFFASILQAEAGLRAMGVQPGELVTILSLNTPESVIAFYAIDRIGAVANWVDMKLSPTEVEGYLTQSASRVVLVLELAFEKVYQNRGSAAMEHFVVLPLAPYLAPSLSEKLGLGRWQALAGPDCLPWATLLKPPVHQPPETARWEEAAAITYTGGTTGPAKGVVLSRRAFRASLVQYCKGETLYGQGGATLTLLPIFAAFGLCQCIHVPLCLGMTVILVPLFRGEQLGELLLRYRPEQVSGTSAYWQLLLQSPEAAEADLSFLEVPRNGGDALSAEMERRINEFLSHRSCTAPLIKEYGMSEVAGIVCLNYGTWREVGCVGHPLPGCRIIAVDPETGRELPSGEQGELLIHSDTVMNGYYAQPQADSQVLKPGPDGQLWVWTKDLGHIRADGGVVVTGRSKRMISRNGFKIFPSVIEDCLLQSELVEACAVVAGVTPAGEIRPVAHIVPKQGAEETQVKQALVALCKQKLNSYILPAAYRFLPELPLTGRGKLDYRALEQESIL